MDSELTCLTVGIAHIWNVFQISNNRIHAQHDKCVCENRAVGSHDAMLPVSMSCIIRNKSCRLFLHKEDNIVAQEKTTSSPYARITRYRRPAVLEGPPSMSHPPTQSPVSSKKNSNLRKKQCQRTWNYQVGFGRK